MKLTPPNITPGPWEAKPQTDKRHRCVSVMADHGSNRSPIPEGEEDSVLVASFSDSHVTHATAHANAVMGAAAPTMAKALAEMILLFPEDPTIDDGTGRRGFGAPLKNAYTKALGALQSAGYTITPTDTE